MSEKFFSNHSANKKGAKLSGERIIVIGASAGGFGPLKRIINGLPPDFQSPIFVVWHMSPDVRGILPQVLSRENSILAAHACNNEEIETNRIYVAPPDYHMLLENNKILITNGPKENRFRPAIDPLFRSAAYAFGNRVIGVVLSGALDDGTAGLWTIKQYGGLAIVQDPVDAEVPSMPENALRSLKVDYCVPVTDLSQLLVRLCKEPPKKTAAIHDDLQTKEENQIAAGIYKSAWGSFKTGELTPFTCPECHGVLAKLQDDKITRYLCHTGHAYSADVLLASITEGIENSLYNALRGMDENIMLLNHLGDHAAEANETQLAALYFKKAREISERSQIVRKVARLHEQLNIDRLRKEAEPDEAC
jgi:two-component system chemotaxis response regulator CheB